MAADSGLTPFKLILIRLLLLVLEAGVTVIDALHAISELSQDIYLLSQLAIDHLDRFDDFPHLPEGKKFKSWQVLHSKISFIYGWKCQTTWQRWGCRDFNVRKLGLWGSRRVTYSGFTKEPSRTD
ncbi:hypothetical protein DFH08DRAFT_816828 [Mycena albidolilacea]|uniref:Uncharacterized protein n=1 Tax=Mycena albidolilacea TaxID=1033008 RepID=A0AAD6ZJ57_9AGAR|nr:hypothetical protein DFH08DRAFT_816828 [Mycena albidolilacea]